MRWYIVHAYSNFERKVAESIKERATAAGLADQIDEVLVPMEEVVEMRRGRKVASERKFFPGYVLVKMDLNDHTYHLIKSTFVRVANCTNPSEPSRTDRFESDDADE